MHSKERVKAHVFASTFVALRLQGADLHAALGAAHQEASEAADYYQGYVAGPTLDVEVSAPNEPDEEGPRPMAPPVPPPNGQKMHAGIPTIPRSE